MRKFFSLFVAMAWMVMMAAAVCRGQGTVFNSPSIADAFVATGPSGGLSSDNFGAAGALAVSASGLPQGEFQSVLKFDLSGAESTFNAQFGAGQWTIQSVTLQLASAPHNNAIFNNVAAGQFGISLMQNNSWVEGTGTGGTPSSDGISFNSLQNVYINNAADQALGIFNFPGGTSGENSYALTLSSGLVSDISSGTDLSLRLFAADSSVSYLFDSRTGGSGASFHPNLAIDAAPVPEPRLILLCVASLAALWLWQVFRRFMRRMR